MKLTKMTFGRGGELASLFVALLAATLICHADAEGFTVRASASGRTWQVSYAPTEPIVWIWPDQATAATLTVTSYVGKTSVATHDITRESGADTGSWSLPNGSGERLYDLALEIRAGEKVLENLSGRVVILPEAIDVISTNSMAWAAVPERSPRPVAYDAAWTTNGTATSAALTLAMVGGTPVQVPLPGVSGYEPLNLTPRLGKVAGPFTAELAFDDDDALYVAQLLRTFPGFVLNVR